jgi:hypothetical protein
MSKPCVYQAQYYERRAPTLAGMKPLAIHVMFLAAVWAELQQWCRYRGFSILKKTSSS